MTINVMTSGYTLLKFDANNWEVDDGRLWVGTEGVGVAEFAKGSWAYIIEDKQPEKVKKPRQWDTLSQAYAAGVKVVTSANGCRWKYFDNEPRGAGENLTGWYWSSAHGREHGYKYDDSAPYTEGFKGEN